MALSDALRNLMHASAKYYLFGAVGPHLKRFVLAFMLLLSAMAFGFFGVLLLLGALLFQLAQVANWVFPFAIVGVVSLLVAALAGVQGSWLFRR